MKASMVSSRRGMAVHNDREFDYSNDRHIDNGRVKDNIYQSYKSLPFAEAEKVFYRDHYSKWLKAQNKRYRQMRKPSKCRSVNDLLSGKYTKPEETIIQIGNKDNHPDRKTFEACVDDYRKELQQYSSNFHVIDWAIHYDEETPHAHFRGVWDYTDKDGFQHIGQEQALKELGFPLPDESQKSGRYNNRKIVFHRHLREKWYDICESHGLEIEREPDPTNTVHLEKNALILREQQKQIEANEQKLAEQSALMRDQEQKLSVLLNRIREEEERLKEEAGRKRTKRYLQERGIEDLIGLAEKERTPGISFSE